MDLANEQLTLQEQDETRPTPAVHDPLSARPDTDLFRTQLLQAIARARGPASSLAVMHVDLALALTGNDAAALAITQPVLDVIGKRLYNGVRPYDGVCSYGRQGFLLLFIEPGSKKNIEGIARRMVNRVAQPLDAISRGLTVRPNIGVAVYPESGTTAEELIRNASLAGERARASMARYFFFEASNEKSLRSMLTALGTRLARLGPNLLRRPTSKLL